MGYAPDWNKGSMKKSGATPVKHGVTSRELFHGAKTVQKFADGGDVLATPDAPAVELNIRGDKVGKYEGNDEIVKYRMNMTDGVGGKSLRYKDNPDMMAEKLMPQSRPYDSIDAIIEAKGTKESKKSDDGGAKFLASQANKATAAITAPKASAPKPATPKAKASVPEFSDDSRSPDQVAEPYRPLINEAEGSYEQLRQSNKEKANTSPTIDRNNRVRLSGRSEPDVKEAPKPGSFRDTIRIFKEGMAETRRK